MDVNFAFNGEGESSVKAGDAFVGDYDIRWAFATNDEVRGWVEGDGDDVIAVPYEQIGAMTREARIGRGCQVLGGERCCMGR